MCNYERFVNLELRHKKSSSVRRGALELLIVSTIMRRLHLSRRSQCDPYSNRTVGKRHEWEPLRCTLGTMQGCEVWSHRSLGVCQNGNSNVFSLEQPWSLPDEGSCVRLWSGILATDLLSLNAWFRFSPWKTPLFLLRGVSKQNRILIER